MTEINNMAIFCYQIDFIKGNGHSTAPICHYIFHNYLYVFFFKVNLTMKFQIV